MSMVQIIVMTRRAAMPRTITNIKWLPIHWVIWVICEFISGNVLASLNDAVLKLNTLPPSAKVIKKRDKIDLDKIRAELQV